MLKRSADDWRFFPRETLGHPWVANKLFSIKYNTEWENNIRRIGMDASYIVDIASKHPDPTVYSITKSPETCDTQVRVVNP
jgi:hypothetical protein